MQSNMSLMFCFIATFKTDMIYITPDNVNPLVMLQEVQSVTCTNPLEILLEDVNVHLTHLRCVSRCVAKVDWVLTMNCTLHLQIILLLI